MRPDDLTKAVDHAAMMSDRWLFLAAITLLILFGLLVIFWLLRQLQALVATHTAIQQEHQQTLRNILAGQNETSLKLAVCLDRNTLALEQCTLELHRIHSPN